MELFQTGLPIAALSSTVGPLRLCSEEREILFEKYVPWAMEQNRKMSSASLLNVYYEEEFDTPLIDLRQRLNIDPAPQVDLK